MVCSMGSQPTVASHHTLDKRGKRYVESGTSPKTAQIRPSAARERVTRYSSVVESSAYTNANVTERDGPGRDARASRGYESPWR